MTTRTFCDRCDKEIGEQDKGLVLGVCAASVGVTKKLYPSVANLVKSAHWCEECVNAAGVDLHSPTTSLEKLTLEGLVREIIGDELDNRA